MDKAFHDEKCVLWKNLLTLFLYRFNELITNYNDVANTSEIIDDNEKKDLLRKSILGHPDLLNVEISALHALR